jgi:hypothetical protein
MNVLAGADDQNSLAVFDEPIEENLSAPHQFLQAMSHTQMFQQ